MSPGSAGREETKLCFHQAREGCAMIPLLLLSSDGAGWGLCWPHCGQFEPLLILRGKSRFPLGKGDLSPVICPSIPTGSSSAQSLSCLSGGAQIRECLTTFRENRLTTVINSWQMSNNYRYIFSAFRNTRALTSSPGPQRPSAALSSIGLLALFWTTYPLNPWESNTEQDEENQDSFLNI